MAVACSYSIGNQKLSEKHAGSWFAVRVRTKCEGRVASVLSGKGYETFVPRYWRARQWSDRVKRVQEPLFAGYLFCQMDTERRLPVLMTPGVLQIVGVDGSPVAVHPNEMAALRRIDDSDVDRQPWSPSPGIPVFLRQGPLRGISGTLVPGNDREKIVVAISVLQRAVAVELSKSWLEETTGT